MQRKGTTPDCTGEVASRDSGECRCNDRCADVGPEAERTTERLYRSHVSASRARATLTRIVAC